MLAIHTRTLALRVLLAVAAIAALSLLSELFVVLCLMTLYPEIRFTGICTILWFAAFCAMLPSWPTPSKISEAPLSRRQRALVFFEVTVVVGIAVTLFLTLSQESLHYIAFGSGLSYLILVTGMALWRWQSDI